MAAKIAASARFTAGPQTVVMKAAFQLWRAAVGEAAEGPHDDLIGIAAHGAAREAGHTCSSTNTKPEKKRTP